MGQSRCIKIQPKAINLSTRLWGIATEFAGVYSPAPRAEVNCLRLNFKISKLGYSDQNGQSKKLSGLMNADFGLIQRFSK